MRGPEFVFLIFIFIGGCDRFGGADAVLDEAECVDRSRLLIRGSRDSVVICGDVFGILSGVIGLLYLRGVAEPDEESDDVEVAVAGREIGVPT